MNNLTLNIAKCNSVSFTTKNNLIDFEYSLNNMILTKPDTFCDLGVIFDQKLSFNDHISHVNSKAYKALGFIIRNCNNFHNVETLKSLFSAFVRPIMEYASITRSVS